MRTTAAATNMKPPPHGTSTVLALLSLSLLLLRLLLRLRLAAFRDAALSLHLLARLRLRPVHLRLPGGATTLRVWCPSSPSSKPPLLLLHGFGGDAKWTWARNLPLLSRHFHVYAPDLVFFGAHSRSASPLRSVAFQARCAADAMRLLGVHRYDVAGISYGGFVAYRMAAAEARGAVGRVVVMTSGVAAAPGEMREMAAREERTVEEALLPKTAEGLRFLVRRSMHRPPPWMPDFVLDDFIQIDRSLRVRRKHLPRLSSFSSAAAHVRGSKEGEGRVAPGIAQERRWLRSPPGSYPGNTDHLGRQRPGVPRRSWPPAALASGREIQARDRQGRRARAAAGGGRACQQIHQVVPPGRTTNWAGRRRGPENTNDHGS
ncbi:uncharacterized protein LOC101785111 isoform X3 [Setaria italica]|uniref:uncharacterized protein LOC101785111 isoform X3 n=1 Tax=Setaria italica TaxID=4555 RepID=UPI000BE4D5E6|nr:uncharacterized protein LOC101785111 isoform X3 [Setaria italica]